MEELIREGARLKGMIEDAQKRLKEIHSRLASMAEFKAGSKTGHMVGAGYKVKVQLKDNEKWHQDRLLQVREAMGFEEFNKLFAFEYKPVSKRVIDSYLEFGDPNLKAGIEWAREVKPGAPQVTYELMEE